MVVCSNAVDRHEGLPQQTTPNKREDEHVAPDAELLSIEEKPVLSKHLKGGTQPANQ